MKRRGLTLAVAIVAGLLSSAVQAQGSYTPPAGSETASAESPAWVEGTVSMSSPDSLVITTAVGNQMTFILDPATTGRSAPAAGDRVKVSYLTEAPGEIRATSVELTAQKELPAQTASTAAAATRTPAEASASAETTVNDVQTGAASPETLPKTASPQPLAALAGLLALAGAGGLALLRRSL